MDRRIILAKALELRQEMEAQAARLKKLEAGTPEYSAVFDQMLKTSAERIKWVRRGGQA